MDIYKIALLGIISAILIMALKDQVPVFTVVISIITGILIILYILPQITIYVSTKYRQFLFCKDRPHFWGLFFFLFAFHNFEIIFCMSTVYVFSFSNEKTTEFFCSFLLLLTSWLSFPAVWFYCFYLVYFFGLFSCII